MIAIHVHGAIGDLGVDAEIVAVIESRAGEGVMRDELKSLGDSLFGFDLQRVVIAACIHAKVVAKVRRAAHQRCARGWIDESRIAEFVEERTTLVRSDGAVTDHAFLIDVVGRPVTGESVRPLISEIGHF